MDDPCVAAPSATPMTGISMARGLFRSLIRTDQPESTKRALALMAGLTMCFCLLVLTAAVYYQAVAFEKVDTGLNVALGTISLTVGTMATLAYHKPEGGQP